MICNIPKPKEQSLKMEGNMGFELSYRSMFSSRLSIYKLCNNLG